MKKRIFIAFVVTCLSTSNLIHAEAALELNPKLGGCYLFSEKEFNAPSPLTNPIPCSKVHNAETFWVGKWSLKYPPSKYTDDAIHTAAEKVCLSNWDYPEDSDLNYWAFFVPSNSQWAKGARWIRCDAMVRVSENGTFSQQYGKWTGNAGLNSGYVI